MKGVNPRANRRAAADRSSFNFNNGHTLDRANSRESPVNPEGEAVVDELVDERQKYEQKS